MIQVKTCLYMHLKHDTLPCPALPYGTLHEPHHPIIPHAILRCTHYPTLPYHILPSSLSLLYLTLTTLPSITHVGDAWSDMREEFKRRSTFRLKEQLIDESTIDDILLNRLSLKIMHFDHLTGSPTQVVSQLMLAGYADSFDYFYQVLHFSVV